MDAKRQEWSQRRKERSVVLDAAHATYLGHIYHI